MCSASKAQDLISQAGSNVVSDAMTTAVGLRRERAILQMDSEAYMAKLADS